MGKSWLYIGISTFLIFLIIFLEIFFIEISTIIILGNRVENSLIGAGWAGFAEVDLERMGERIGGVDDPQTREIWLNKPRAEAIVRDYIRANLQLGAGDIPTSSSYLPVKDTSVIIEEINIFNPDDLPAIVNNGTRLERTTIQIIVQIPMDIKGVGKIYARKNVLVDIDSMN